MCIIDGIIEFILCITSVSTILSDHVIPLDFPRFPRTLCDVSESLSLFLSFFLFDGAEKSNQVALRVRGLREEEEGGRKGEEGEMRSQDNFPTPFYEIFIEERRKETREEVERDD